jgi:hypothetical protein
MPTSKALELAKRELKRADHSIAVSLKYTRTVDVIKSIIERLINTIGYSFDTLLNKAKTEKKITEVPELPRLKIEYIKKVYCGDEVIENFIRFYNMLRKISKASFEREQEYRRHVTMKAHLDDGSTIEITIDIITDYYNRVKELLGYAEQIVTGEVE